MSLGSTGENDGGGVIKTHCLGGGYYKLDRVGVSKHNKFYLLANQMVSLASSAGQLGDWAIISLKRAEWEEKGPFKQGPNDSHKYCCNRSITGWISS